MNICLNSMWFVERKGIRRGKAVSVSECVAFSFSNLS